MKKWLYNWNQNLISASYMGKNDDKNYLCIWIRNTKNKDILSRDSLYVHCAHNTYVFTGHQDNAILNFVIRFCRKCINDTKWPTRYGSRSVFILKWPTGCVQNIGQGHLLFCHSVPCLYVTTFINEICDDPEIR